MNERKISARNKFSVGQMTQYINSFHCPTLQNCKQSSGQVRKIFHLINELTGKLPILVAQLVVYLFKNTVPLKFHSIVVEELRIPLIEMAHLSNLVVSNQKFVLFKGKLPLILR